MGLSIERGIFFSRTKQKVAASVGAATLGLSLAFAGADKAIASENSETTIPVTPITQFQENPEDISVPSIDGINTTTTIPLNTTDTIITENINNGEALVKEPFSAEVTEDAQKLEAADAPQIGFPDIGSSPYKDAILEIQKRGIINGFEDGTFKPDRLVTRQQFAKMIVLALGVEASESNKCRFPDLGSDDPNSLYPHDLVEEAARIGVIKGYTDGNFRPTENIMRAHIITMVARALDNLNPGLLSDYPDGYQSRVGNFEPAEHSENWKKLEHNGILENLAINDPFAKGTRGEIAQILWNYIQAKETGSHIPQVEQEQPEGQNEYDLVIYADNISSVGAALGALDNDNPNDELKIAILSRVGSGIREDAVSNGLGVEDLYDGDNVASGFYAKFRNKVLDYYSARGINAKVGGRVRVEPEVAFMVLEELLPDRVKRFQNTFLLEVTGEEGNRQITFESNGQTKTIQADSVIDASPEGDLARKMGVNYKIGTEETVYNDYGRTPENPTSQNGFRTAPQTLSNLATIQTYRGEAPKARDLQHSLYNPEAYDPSSIGGIENFAYSWTMQTAILPNTTNDEGEFTKRELNEVVNEVLDAQMSFDFIMHPESRVDINRILAQRAVNVVGWLQENGYAHIGLANLQNYPYVREGIRIVGKDILTGNDVVNETSRNPIALGCYATFDRHYPTSSNYGSNYVLFPMGAIQPEGFPDLLVAQAVSSDIKGYNSASRMEHMRANVGYSAGALIGLADKLQVNPHDISYSLLKSSLLSNGFKLYIR